MLDARDLPDGQSLSTDICIVGAGAAGIALALEFIGSGLRVLLIEAGGLRSEQEPPGPAQTLDDGLHDEHPPRRIFGGAEGERSSVGMLFDIADFEPRAQFADSGWPFPADSLRPFYARALTLTETAGAAGAAAPSVPAAETAAPLIEGFVSASFVTGAPDRPLAADFGKRFADRLRKAGEVCVLLHATATELRTDAGGGAVAALTLRTASGKTLEVNASQFVLAAGALDTARLLLAQRDALGNGHDTVGRYCLIPLEGSIGTLSLARPAAGLLRAKRADSPGRRPLLLDAQAQRHLRIGSFGLRLHPLPPAPAGRLSTALWQRPKILHYRVDFIAEQQAHPANRVSLGEGQDAFGLPRLRVDWRCSAADRDTVRRGLGQFADDVRQSGIGSFDYDAAALDELLGRLGAHGARLLGTARIGADPRSSVADAQCRVHGVANLFVAGAAALPSCPAADPLLTLIALSLRLADHLKALEAQATAPAPPELPPAPQKPKKTTALG